MATIFSLCTLACGQAGPLFLNIPTQDEKPGKGVARTFAIFFLFSFFAQLLNVMPK